MKQIIIYIIQVCNNKVNNKKIFKIKNLNYRN